MKEKNITDSSISNTREDKKAVKFFPKSESPKGFKESLKMLLNLVLNLFG